MQADLPTTAVPETVTISAGGCALLWRQGDAEQRIEAAWLRRACRCATCAAARLSGTTVDAAPGVRLTVATPIGGFALNLVFSDGHARGVFPFAYLAELAAEYSRAAEQAA